MLGGLVLFRNLGFQLSKGQRNVLSFVLVATFIYMLAPYSAYYISKIEVYLMLICIFIISTFGRNMTTITEKLKVRPLFIASFVIYFVITLIVHGEKPSVGVLCAILMGYYVLSLKIKYKIWLFDRFVSLLALTFGLSALEYLFGVFLGISHINTTPIYRFETDAHYFYQGIITIFPYYYQTGLARFQAFTEEPGLVGTLCAFMLACLDLKQNKWQILIFVVCGILSMSLAFYLMFALWLVYSAVNLKNIRGKILLIAFIFLIFCLAQNEVTELVAGRITGKSIAEIDNRGTATFKNAFDAFLCSNDAMFGCGLRTFHDMFDNTGESGGNAGAKPFIYSYGFFSMFLLFLTYTGVFIRTNGRNSKAMFILLVFWLSFYQREYWYAPYNIIPLFMYGVYDLYIEGSKTAY